MKLSTMSATGVLVLQTYQLKKKEQDSLAHILEHDSVVLCPDPALNVPVTATLWLTAEQDDIEQACNGSSKVGKSKGAQVASISLVLSKCHFKVDS